MQFSLARFLEGAANIVNGQLQGEILGRRVLRSTGTGSRGE
jgi:hypothetical protein